MSLLPSRIPQNPRNLQATIAPSFLHQIKEVSGGLRLGIMFSNKKGKSKEKEGDASKSRKKSRRQVVESDEEMEAPQIPKPKRTRRNNLSELAVKWQEELYMSKFEGVKHMENIFVCERAFLTKDLWILGVFHYFERLGCGATLTFRYPKQMDRIPSKDIMQ
ncbi:hypothetical protein L1987_32592 [Smallanthus sonchifolius]|uniref:Uncharacterized protein n=1 Tax=Smallanthus sonchifolius TaxID=185202 RepID=A0ACB9HQ08_9ASTR|nr:hypothetical protein L1987_32592 [Smallanthus sonchifolius]